MTCTTFPGTNTTGSDVPRLRRFCESTLRLDRAPVRFDGRPYLDEIFRALDRNLVLRAGRQVEKSSFLSFRIIFELLRPGTRVLLVCPREKQAMVLMRSRFLPILHESPLLKGCLPAPKRFVGNMLRFENGSELYVYSAFRSADGVRGVSADVLVVDEYQDIAPGVLPVLQETQSHSKRPITILSGTSKQITNALEDAFACSTARAWTVQCVGCGMAVVPNVKTVRPDQYQCPGCERAIDWKEGAWVAGNPHSKWGEGFWVPQIIGPWAKPANIFQKMCQYDPDRVLNEVFGEPTMCGTLAMTRAQLEACCSARPMARSAADVPSTARHALVLGIDWGGGVNGQAAVVIASLCPHSERLQVWHWGMIGGADRSVLDDVRQLCSRFQVSKIFADARGGGAVQNRALSGHLGGERGPTIVGIQYGDHDGRVVRDGTIDLWPLEKTKWVGGLCTRVRERLVEFPESADCQLGFAHLGSEEVIFDEESRTTQYRPADRRPDDLLHALVYAVAGVTKPPAVAEQAFDVPDRIL